MMSQIELELKSYFVWKTEILMQTEAETMQRNLILRKWDFVSVEYIVENCYIKFWKTDVWVSVNNERD